MMVGLLLTSIGSGQLISRTGHYKIFPIIGTALMTFGLLLLSRLDVDTSWLDASLYMFVFRMGLGLVMQVTIIAVQSAVEYQDLGSATSGVTYFRSIGGSFARQYSARSSPTALARTSRTISAAWRCRRGWAARR